MAGGGSHDLKNDSLASGGRCHDDSLAHDARPHPRPGEEEEEDHRERRLEHLARQARRLALTLERMRIAEFVRLTEKPRHLFYVNFLAGLGRGLGIAVGFTLLGALLVYLLRRTVMLNLPGIGSFIAELVMIVQRQIRP